MNVQSIEAIIVINMPTASMMLDLSAVLARMGLLEMVHFVKVS